MFARSDGVGLANQPLGRFRNSSFSARRTRRATRSGVRAVRSSCPCTASLRMRRSWLNSAMTSAPAPASSMKRALSRPNNDVQHAGCSKETSSRPQGHGTSDSAFCSRARHHVDRGRGAGPRCATSARGARASQAPRAAEALASKVAPCQSVDIISDTLPSLFTSNLLFIQAFLVDRIS